VSVFLTVTFVAMISTVPIIQTALELRQGGRPQVLDIFTQKPTEDNLRAYETNLEEASWVVKALRPWMQYAQFVLLKDAGDKALVGREGWVFYKPGMDYITRRPAAKKATDGAGDPLPAIVSFRDQLAGRGIQLLILPAPNKESIYPEMVARRAAHMRVAVCPQTRDLFTRLKASGVEAVNLFEIFREAKEAEGQPGKETLYLSQDSHWSPEGVKLAAKAVAQRVLEQGWARLGTVDYDERPVQLRRVGDVLAMLQVRQIERHVAPQQFTCEQVLRRDNGALYEDQPDSEILVLGDSFLRIFEQDEPRAAGFVARLARELKQPLTSIINDGGASTLVRQELYRRPELLANKKLVIWEFVERDIRFGTEGWQVVPLPELPSLVPGQ
jgi:hypothetical protein